MVGMRKFFHWNLFRNMRSGNNRVRASDVISVSSITQGALFHSEWMFRLKRSTLSMKRCSHRFVPAEAITSCLQNMKCNWIGQFFSSLCRSGTDGAQEVLPIGMSVGFGANNPGRLINGMRCHYCSRNIDLKRKCHRAALAPTILDKIALIHTNDAAAYTSCNPIVIQCCVCVFFLSSHQ